MYIYILQNLQTEDEKLLKLVYAPLEVDLQ